MSSPHPSKRRWCGRKRRGAALVEAAIVGPAAVLVVLGGIDVGRIFLVRHTVDGVAYEAAQLGLMPGATKEQVVNEASSYLSLFRIRDATIEVTPEELGVNARRVTVHLEVPWQSNAWFLRSVHQSLVAECTVESDRVISYLPANLQRTAEL